MAKIGKIKYFLGLEGVIDYNLVEVMLLSNVKRLTFDLCRWRRHKRLGRLMLTW